MYFNKDLNEFLENRESKGIKRRKKTHEEDSLPKSTMSKNRKESVGMHSSKNHLTTKSIQDERWTRIGAHSTGTKYQAGADSTLSRPLN